jgi:hypothetical protein
MCALSLNFDFSLYFGRVARICQRQTFGLASRTGSHGRMHCQSLALTASAREILRKPLLGLLERLTNISTGRVHKPDHKSNDHDDRSDFSPHCLR